VAFSEIDLKRISNVVGGLCREKSPSQYKDQLPFTYEIETERVLMFEERPRRNNPTEWSKIGVAKFRYIQSKKQWKLYWMRQDFK